VDSDPLWETQSALSSKTINSLIPPSDLQFGSEHVDTHCRHPRKGSAGDESVADHVWVAWCFARSDARNLLRHHALHLISFVDHIAWMAETDRGNSTESRGSGIY